jgi:hypothetical protein
LTQVLALSVCLSIIFSEKSIPFPDRALIDTPSFFFLNPQPLSTEQARRQIPELSGEGYRYERTTSADDNLKFEGIRTFWGEAT